MEDRTVLLLLALKDLKDEMRGEIMTINVKQKLIDVCEISNKR